MSCLQTISDYGLRSLGIGERLLPKTDITICEQFVLIGSGLFWNIYFAIFALSIGFINIPTFLIFIPITTFMARIGARTVHNIDKNKISKYFGFFLLIIAIKFFYEYLKL